MPAAASTMPPKVEPAVSGRWIQPPGSIDDLRSKVLRALREGGDKPTDLAGIRLVGEDLAGCDLSGCDLTGADLSRADLTGARLIGANLSAATLHQTKLDEAELAKTTLLGATLEGASAKRAGFGKADLRRTSFFGATLDGASFVEARLRHTDFRNASARDARFSDCDLSRSDFSTADLAGAELSSADVDRAYFVETDLRRARLRSLRNFERASFLRADVRDVDFSGAYMLRRHVLDENFLDEFKNRSPMYRFVYWVWWASSDCGRSLTRWTAWTMLIALAFGFVFAQVAMDFGDHETWLSPFYYSVVTLTTLGYGDVLPASEASQWCAMAEVTIGYLMLGGLISIFSNKLARRGE